MKSNGRYPVHVDYNCIDAYSTPKNEEDWKECLYCNLKPKIWEFDNGRSTACGCWESKYEYFSIHAESIMSVHKRTEGKGMLEYSIDGLQLNWNHWCDTGEINFEHASERKDGKIGVIK